MYKNKNASKNYGNRGLRSKRIIALALLLLLLATGLIWKIMHTQHAVSGPIHATSPNQSSASNDKTTKKDAAVVASTDTVTDPGKTVATHAVGDSSLVLAEGPTGTFVSNHRPSLSGKSSPSSEQSACNTLPGATCYIKFTKDGVVKTLPTQAADSNGTVIWNWDIKQAGFDEGSWQITAVATLNGQSKSTNDSLALEVQP